MVSFSKIVSVAAVVVSVAHGQTFRRLGACPTLGCVFPPDQADFLAGQYFDIRLEVHAPVNGSEANGGVPDEKFTFTIAKSGGSPSSATSYFKVAEPSIEKWDFSWYEDLYAEEEDEASVVNVASKIYRRVALYEPGEYVATLTYYNGTQTIANWVVRDIQEEKKAKNVILFIGDGMTTNMITAARLIGHKAINGKYQSRMAMDKFPVLGHQMTHSLDTFITDSANSASALYSGHKSTVNAMGVYADSSPDPFDDPKVETIVELVQRIWGSAFGIVTTATLADATPIAATGHSRSRYTYGPLIDQALNGVTNYTWTEREGPTVFFGAGGENFLPGSGSYEGKDYYDEFRKAGYSVSLNKTSLAAAPNSQKALGVFCTGNLPVWLDRNIYKGYLNTTKNDPSGNKGPALDLPGLKDMTLKAVEILSERSNDKGFFLMSEGASIDKQMHALDYDRALGDLLEFDDTIAATIEKLKELGEFENTLIIVTADHGHGFDVFGSADTEYLTSKTTNREKRNAVGIYERSGESQYQVAAEGVSYNTGPNFPVNWSPRYTLAQGFGAMPDHREDYKVRSSPRGAATNITGYPTSDLYANPKDSQQGYIINGTLPTSDAQGVHSLTDVPVFAMGPCSELFGGVYGNIDIFFNMANCLGLGRSNNASQTNTTIGGSPTSQPQFTGGAVSNQISNSMTGAILIFMGAVGWVGLNL